MHEKLSLAFIWHFHQPDYRAQQDGIRLMPWARLHAVKDYLDMLKIIDKFPNIKLNFSIDPALLDTIEDYAYRDAHDIHSKLTITPVEELSEDDKIYILNYFFDANYDNLISQNERYNELYKKRYAKSNVQTGDFSDAEYSDLMFLFNFVWFDPMWRKAYPELEKLGSKKKNYNLLDRIKIIELQRKIIKQIIPSFKKYQDARRAEIMTTPYNHPIIPILAGLNEIKNHSYKYPFPEFKLSLSNDAKEQIKKALDRMEEIFGRRPKGVWPSEQCISPKALELFSACGFEWTIADESVLSDSLDKEFVRDFRGCYEDPYDVCSVYGYKTKKEKDINIIFRDSVIPNLISFEYPYHKSEFCANDLFDRIKTVYDKLRNSPDESHILTIAMDGENCWETYENDGITFLEKLYSLINNDGTIKTVLLSEYMEETRSSVKPIKKIVPGSGADSDFRLWIAEPTKNLAWQYLMDARIALRDAETDEIVSKQALEEAKNEIFIAEGSDWFWWYGEPNNSGQDHIFDFLYRERLKNVYTILNKQSPSYLETPLTAIMGKPLREPGRYITPIIDGSPNENTEWGSAGCIDIPDGPVLQENKIFNRIYFGNDFDNLYIRFDINRYLIENNDNFNEPFSIYIYLKSYGENVETVSPVRTSIKTNNIPQVFSEGYTHELKISLSDNLKYPFSFSKSIRSGLWKMQWEHEIKYAFDEILEVSIPFENLNAGPGTDIDFLILTGTGGITENVYPKDIPITLKRPSPQEKENPSFV